MSKEISKESIQLDAAMILINDYKDAAEEMTLEYRKILHDRTASIDGLQGQVTDLKKRLSELNEQLDGIHSSRLWRAARRISKIANIVQRKVKGN